MKAVWKGEQQKAETDLNPISDWPHVNVSVAKTLIHKLSLKSLAAAAHWLMSLRMTQRLCPALWFP